MLIPQWCPEYNVQKPVLAEKALIVVLGTVETEQEDHSFEELTFKQIPHAFYSEIRNYKNSFFLISYFR